MPIIKYLHHLIANDGVAQSDRQANGPTLRQRQDLQDVSFEWSLDHCPAAELSVIAIKLLAVGESLGNSAVSKADLGLRPNRVYSIQPMQHCNENRQDGCRSER